MTEPRKPKPRAATLDHLKKKRKPFKDVFVCLEPELQTAAENAAGDLAEAELALYAAEHRGAGEAELTVLRDAVTAAKEASDSAHAERVKQTVKLRVQSIGRKAYEALVEACPPTEAQIATFQEEAAAAEEARIAEAISKGQDPPAPRPLGKPEYDTDVFPAALIAACLIEPKLSAAEVVEVTEDWNFNEFVQLFMACTAVNGESRVEAWGNAFG